MPVFSAPQYRFLSAALPADAFQVLRFAGKEAVSALYEFDVLLVATKPDYDLAAIMEAPASLALLREPLPLVEWPDLKEESKDKRLLLFQGAIVSCELLRPIGQGFLYRVILKPKAWRLTAFRRNQIFLNKTAPQFLTKILTEAGLQADRDFEFRLRSSYPVWEYVCQYEETHFDFLNRWLEREGLYYFFEQGPDGEKLVLTDHNDVHVNLGEEELVFAPDSGLDGEGRILAVHRFQTRYEPVLKSVRVQDYNYRTPSLPLSAVAEVDPHGQGELHCYAEHPRTPAESARMAKIRAEELRCRQQLSSGSSYAPLVRSGFLFTLRNHYRSSANEEHLALSVAHEGGQEELLRRMTGQVGEDARDFYHNAFTAIPAATQFRPPLVTPKPRFHGVINAHIDAQGTGEFAELDEQGRYKVRLPFDLSDRPGGAASTWLRRAQPYAGADHGWHFPLHKGVEVLLAFLDGDPDRPVILGAAPNPLTPSPTRDVNQTKHQLVTAGQNKLQMEDKAGSQRILMQTPTKNTWLRLGASNDPPGDLDFQINREPEGEQETFSEGAMWYTEGSYYGIFKQNVTMYVGSNYTEFIFGGLEEVILGMENISVVGLKTTVSVSGNFVIKTSYNHETNPFHCNTTEHLIEVAGEDVKDINKEILVAGDKIDAINEDMHASKARVRIVNDTLQTASEKTTAEVNAVKAVGDSIIAGNQKKVAAVAEFKSATQSVSAAETADAQIAQRIQQVSDKIDLCARKTGAAIQQVQTGAVAANAVGAVQVV